MEWIRRLVHVVVRPLCPPNGHLMDLYTQGSRTYIAWDLVCQAMLPIHGDTYSCDRYDYGMPETRHQLHQ